VAGIAVADGNQLLGEIMLNTKNTHSEKLMPLVQQLLQELQLTVQDLDAIAVTQGPGSFTGLRIGMATAKGLVQGAGKQLIAVPTLDCLAQNLLHYPGIICPIMNAQKKQVYTALYRGVDKLERLSDYQAIEAETAGNATQVCGYWSGSDGSCAQLYVLVGLKNTYEVGIAISGPSDRVKPSSGSKDLTPVLEKFPLGNTP